MATFTPKVLGEGQAANSLTAIYTVPGSTKAYIKRLRLFSIDADAQTVIVSINTAGTDRTFARFVFAQNESAELLDGQVLEAGDIIKVSATEASAVNYVLSGVEETA